MPDAKVPAGTTCWIVTDGKIGDEVQCFGIAEAMGLSPERRLIRPRALWAWAMPYGPIDPREAPHRPGSPIAPPFPDILIASGRRTVPYLRRAKKASGGRTFTLFVKDPYTGLGTADLICVHGHDRLRGPNVIVALTPANRLSPELFAQARENPDPRLAHLAAPRLAIALGGPSNNFTFTDADAESLARIAAGAARAGHSVMVTPSRRTPPGVTAAIRAALAERRSFVWDGAGENPYVQILAHAEVILVTSDSANMLGEAVTTGKAVYVYEPFGKGQTALVESLVARGAVRRFAGALERFEYEPIVSTQVIAAEAVRRFGAFKLNPASGPRKLTG